MVLVSVIVPVYGRPRFLRESFDSVLKQTVRDIEFIIILDKDGSIVDESESIAREYSLNDDRIILEVRTQKTGTAAAFNRGIELSNGSFISFIGSDDIWEVNKLEIQLKAAKKCRDCVIWTNAEIIDANGERTGNFFLSLFSNFKVSNDSDTFSHLMYENFVPSQSILVPNDRDKRVWFDQNFGLLDDYQYIIKLADNFTFHYVDQCLVKYRIHGDNNITNFRKLWRKDLIKIETFKLKEIESLSRNQRAFIHFKLGFNSLLNKDIISFLKYTIGGLLDSPLTFVTYLFSIRKSVYAKKSIQNIIHD